MRYVRSIVSFRKILTNLVLSIHPNTFHFEEQPNPSPKSALLLCTPRDVSEIPWAYHSCSLNMTAPQNLHFFSPKPHMDFPLMIKWCYGLDVCPP